MGQRGSRRPLLKGCGLALLLTIVFALVWASRPPTFAATAHPAQIPPTHTARKSGPLRPSTAPEIAMPFAMGETLDYRIGWAAFSTAANLEMKVPERRDLYGWRTWHLQAAFHTLRPVRNLFAIDDQFDSYTDRSTLESRQFESYISELGKSESHVLHLIPAGQPPRAPGAAVVVRPGTRDPLGMLYTLRSNDWSKTPELRAPVYDGNNLYEMRAHIEASVDPVHVDAGAFNASRISIKLFQNEKENSGIHFTIWLANDAAHTPVLISAQLPFGSLRVELTQARH